MSSLIGALIGAFALALAIPVVRPLVLSFGADPNQRGINDYTALHMAVTEENIPAIEVLLRAGADASLRTRIDHYETANELAARAGLTDMVAALEAAGIKI